MSRLKREQQSFLIDRTHFHRNPRLEVLMTSLRTAALVMSLSLLGAIMAPPVPASPEFVNGLALDGACSLPALLDATR